LRKLTVAVVFREVELMRGRPPLYIPPVKLKEIKQLHEQGCGVWAIARDLKAQGYSVSMRTIERIVKSFCPPHHWIVDTFASQGQYHAKCKKCGAERDLSGWCPGENEKLLAISKEQRPRKGRPQNPIPAYLEVPF
jgi:hypothetical protein